MAGPLIPILIYTRPRTHAHMRAMRGRARDTRCAPYMSSECDQGHMAHPYIICRAAASRVCDIYHNRLRRCAAVVYQAQPTPESVTQITPLGPLSSCAALSTPVD